MRIWSFSPTGLGSYEWGLIENYTFSFFFYQTIKIGLHLFLYFERSWLKMPCEWKQGKGTNLHIRDFWGNAFPSDGGFWLVSWHVTAFGNVLHHSFPYSSRSSYHSKCCNDRGTSGGHCLQSDVLAPAPLWKRAWRAQNARHCLQAGPRAWAQALSLGSFPLPCQTCLDRIGSKVSLPCYRQKDQRHV